MIMLSHFNMIHWIHTWVPIHLCEIFPVFCFGPCTLTEVSNLDGGVRGLAPHPLSHVAPVDDGRRVAAPRLAPQRRTLPRHRRRGVRPDGNGSLSK